jgi:hypothetical protein
MVCRDSRGKTRLETAGKTRLFARMEVDERALQVNVDRLRAAGEQAEVLNTNR